jgi:hypothetical protein
MGLLYLVPESVNQPRSEFEHPHDAGGIPSAGCAPRKAGGIHPVLRVMRLF